MAILTPIMAPMIDTATGATALIALKACVWITPMPSVIALVMSTPVVGFDNTDAKMFTFSPPS
jgi:hypothetical protein